MGKNIQFYPKIIFPICSEFQRMSFNNIEGCQNQELIHVLVAQMNDVTIFLNIIRKIYQISTNIYIKSFYVHAVR